MKNNFDCAAAIGEIILKARGVEAQLHQAAGGEVTGIHALTELLGDKLPEELKRKLHYVATIRNQAAHEAEFAIDEAGFAAFSQAADEAGEALDRLFPECAGSVSLDNSEAPLDVAVERTALTRMAKKLHWMGFIPLVGVLNLLRIFLGCIWAQMGLLVLILFYLASIPMLIDGVRCFETKPELLYTGGAVALAVYVVTVVTSFFIKTVKLPKFLVWVPGLNVIYLVVLFFSHLAWGRFLISLAGIAALSVSFSGVIAQRWELAGYALLAEWILSVIASLAFPPAKDGE